MALNPRVFSVVGHRVEVEIEGVRGKELVFRDRAMPGREQARGAGVIQARGILAQVALFGDRVEPAKERQPRIGDQRHDMTLALDRPELERERGQ